MTDTVTGITLSLPKYDPEFSDHGREDTLMENLTFSNIIMDCLYAHPVKIRLFAPEETRCKAIRNIYFSDIHAKALEFPLIKGNEACKIQNLTFSNCTFEKVSDDVLPDFRKHGSADWGRTLNVPVIRFAENITFHNTKFSAD